MPVVPCEVMFAVSLLILSCFRPVHLHAASPPAHPFLPVFASWWNAVLKKTTSSLFQFQTGHRKANRFIDSVACRSTSIVVLFLLSTAACGHRCRLTHSWKWLGSADVVTYWLKLWQLARQLLWSLLINFHLYIKVASCSTNNWKQVFLNRICM